MVCVTAGKGKHHVAKSRTFIEWCYNIQTRGNETDKLKNQGAFDWTAHRKGTEYMIFMEMLTVGFQSIFIFFVLFYSDSAQSLGFEQLPLVIVFSVKGS